MNKTRSHDYFLNCTAGLGLRALLPTELAGKIMQSVASVRPFASSPFAEPTDLLYVHGSRRQLAGIESQGHKSRSKVNAEHCAARL